MKIEQNADGKFVIRHSGRIVVGILEMADQNKAGPFDTEQEAEHWADMWVDDQVFGRPNHFAPPLVYADEAGAAIGGDHD